MKIAVLGFSGSGKSTLSKQLGEFYDIPVLHLDTVQFTEGWVERDDDEGREIVKKFMENSDWSIDGNYAKFLRDERLREADKIIILYFNRFTCLCRVIKRYLTYRGKTREDMADGCIEKLDLEFVWWILHEGRTKMAKDKFKSFAEEYPDKTVMLRNQSQADKYIEEL